ncbi:MAG: hypothetical protein LBT74_13290 [Acidobacteriota bacterium]|nr:hypothetical protein [Acidobacteriota bacterium]
MAKKTGFLTDGEQEAIAAAVRRAEAGTSGEIVFSLSPASGRYRHATLLGALCGMAVASAVFLSLPFGHSVARLLWVEALSFAASYAAFLLPPFRRLPIARSAMEERVREAAFVQFYAAGLHQTRESNGVEIYLSLFERMVVVIGDKGVNAKMGGRGWDEVRDAVIGGIRAGKACEGICEAVGICGRVLAEHFPPRPDDVNELPDQVLHRGEGARR